MRVKLQIGDYSRVCVRGRNWRKELEMSKWVSTREPTRLTTGSSRVGLRKIQLF